MNYPNLGPRIILDPYRGINFWNPHYNLLGIIYHTHSNRGRLSSPWRANYAYTLGVI